LGKEKKNDFFIEEGQVFRTGSVENAPKPTVMTKNK
jgi:hypothetical protein